MPRQLAISWGSATTAEVPRGITARKKFYRISSVLRRLSGNMYSPLIYFATNYGHMKQVKVEGKRIAKLKTELFENQLNKKSVKPLNGIIMAINLIKK